MRSLASWLLWSVVGILLSTAVVGGVLQVWHTSTALDEQYEERARVVAAAVADIPGVAMALPAADPTGLLQPLALAVQHDTAPTW